jgi:hypothetical protein
VGGRESGDLLSIGGEPLGHDSFVDTQILADLAFSPDGAVVAIPGTGPAANAVCLWAMILKTAQSGSARASSEASAACFQWASGENGSTIGHHKHDPMVNSGEAEEGKLIPGQASAGLLEPRP